MQTARSGKTFAMWVGASLTIGLTIVWSLYRSGLDTVFYLHTDALRASNWPNPELRSEEAYTRTSAIGPWLYKLLGGDSDLKYLILCVAAAVIGLGLVAIWCWRFSPPTQRSRAVRLVLLSPIVAILVTQIGNYDPFTVLGFGAFLWAWSAGSRLLLVASGIYLGVQHFEQGMIAVMILGIFTHFAQDWIPTRIRALRSPFWAILGLIAGKILLSAILLANHVSSTDGRLSWVSDPELLRHAIIGSINFLPVLILSFFAGAWAIVFAATLTEMRPRLIIVLSGVLLISGFFSVVTLDHTRIFVMITLPLLAVLTVSLLTQCSGEQSRKTLVLVEAMAWIVVPISVLTSPDGPTFIKELNVADHALMVSHQLLNMF